MFFGKIEIMIATLLRAGHQKVKGEEEDQKPCGDPQWRKKGMRQAGGHRKKKGRQKPTEKGGKAL